MSREKLKQERKKVKDGAEREAGQDSRICELESMIEGVRREVEEKRVRIVEAELRNAAKDEALTVLEKEADVLRTKLTEAITSSAYCESVQEALRGELSAALIAIRKMHQVSYGSLFPSL